MAVKRGFSERRRADDASIRSFATRVSDAFRSSGFIAIFSSLQQFAANPAAVSTTIRSIDPFDRLTDAQAEHLRGAVGGNGGLDQAEAVHIPEAASRVGIGKHPRVPEVHAADAQAAVDRQRFAAQPVTALP